MSKSTPPSPNRFAGSQSYVATDDLKLVVNAAIALQRPLLIKGEPGTGKTMLAEEVAAALKAFYQVRSLPGLKKKPSTSELIDWLKLLLAEDIPPEALQSSDEKIVVPPLHGALLKNEQDIHLFERLVMMNRNHR